jgi:glutamine amidotransferase
MEGRIPENLKIPQIGWNSLSFKKQHPLLKYIRNGDYVYFVHSFFAADCEESLVAVTEYGCEMTAVAARDRVMGCQFHPEKSGEVGLSILKAFCEMN